MRLAALVFLVLAVFGGGCQRSLPIPGAGTTKEPRSSSFPSKAEVLEYLDGKTISLTKPMKTPEKGNPAFVLKKDQIEALEVGSNAGRIGDGPWTTTVTFIAKTDQGRYAINCDVHYRIVEGKCAFFGLDVREAAKQ